MEEGSALQPISVTDTVTELLYLTGFLSSGNLSHLLFWICTSLYELKIEKEPRIRALDRATDGVFYTPLTLPPAVGEALCHSG